MCTSIHCYIYISECTLVKAVLSLLNVRFNHSNYDMKSTGTLNSCDTIRDNYIISQSSTVTYTFANSATHSDMCV